MLKRNLITSVEPALTPPPPSLSPFESLLMPIYVNRLDEYWTMDERAPAATAVDEAPKVNQVQESTLQKESTIQEKNFSDSQSSIANFLPKYRKFVTQDNDATSKKQKITEGPTREGTPIPPRASRSRKI